MFLKVTAQLHPTEYLERVEKSIKNLFTGLSIERFEEGRMTVITGTSESRSSLKPFHEKIRKQKILDAVRGKLLANIEGNKTHISLNKQAAFMDTVNLGDENYLGNIEITIESENLRQIIDWLAPKTVEGKEI